MAAPETLQRWIGSARRILKSGGVLTLIWRADGISEAFAALGRGFGSLAVLPVHSDAKRPAIRVLIRAVKGGRAPTQIFPALMLNDESALPHQRVAQILAGQGLLPLAIP
jgi:tRNA1(Val) A37 N6-methylase TrmN6